MSFITQAAVLAVPLLGFTTAVIDLGWLRSIDGDLQNAADSAALAAAAHLSSPEGAVKTASTFAAMHTAAGSAIKVGSSDVQIGTWEGGQWTTSSTGKYVRVTAKATPPSLMSRMFGKTKFSLSRTSIASIRGATRCGLIGLKAVEVLGSSKVNGYDSTTATSAAPVNTAGSTTNYGTVTYDDSAGICSNNTSVTIGGSTAVTGGVLAGPAGSVSVKSPASVSSTKGSLSLTLVGPTVSKPGTYAALPAQIVAATKLSPGNYYLKGNFSLTGKGSISTSGQTDLYVDGNFSMEGPLYNLNRDPHQLTIHIIGTHTVTNKSTYPLYASVIAPDSDVSLNSAYEFYGYAVAATLRLNGTAAVHQDTSLVASASGGNSVLID